MVSRPAHGAACDLIDGLLAPRPEGKASHAAPDRCRGKLKQGPERELFAHYVGRANATVRKIGLTPLSVIEVAEAKSATAQVRMETEAKALLAKLPSSHKLICLDRGGDQFRSEDFAQTLAKFRDGGAQGLAFLVGGADGLGLTAVFKADRVLSLGPLTHMGSPASFWPSRSTGPGPFSGSSLSPRLTPQGLSIGKRFALILPYRSVVVAVG